MTGSVSRSGVRWVVIVIVLAVAVAAGFVWIGGATREGGASPAASATDASGAGALDDGTDSRTPDVAGDAGAHLPRLLDLGADKCVPCKAMAPILEAMRETFRGRFDVEFIDVGLRENQALARRYGIRLIPTQIFFDAEGNELWRHEGFLGKDEILARWRELGVTFEAR